MDVRRWIWGLAGVSLFMAAGCGSSKDDAVADAELPDWMQEDGGAAKPKRIDADAAPEGSLELKLKVGDRFGLRKSVDSTLQQSAPDNTTQTVLARIDMLLGLTVEDVSDRGTRLGVRYERVQYRQGQVSESFEYDSMQPPAEVPTIVRPYHNMVRDGFSFWIGKENQITEVIGFKEFLERCMAGVPEGQRLQQMLNMEAASDENGISDFVDNTVGLLPYGRSIRPGDTWEKVRHVGRPVPMMLTHQYTLKDLNEQMALVDIRGTIAPSTSGVDVGPDVSGMRVTVTGGSLQGDCAIYRDTGLPQRSMVERSVDMIVTLGAQHEFRQKKTVRTTVESFPMQNSGTPTRIGFNPSEPVTGKIETAAQPPLLLPAQ
jgi:hypothetical protein